MSAVADTTFRLRVTYGKSGRLSYLSHLEVVRACERAVRRADLPYAVTQGLYPKDEGGVRTRPAGRDRGGWRRRYDVWLTRFVPAGGGARPARGGHPGRLSPMAAVYVPESEPSLSAALTIADYEVKVQVRAGAGRSERRGMEAVLSDGALEVQHKGKDKVYDLATVLPKEPSSGESERRDAIDA